MLAPRPLTDWIDIRPLMHAQADASLAEQKLQKLTRGLPALGVLNLLIRPVAHSEAEQEQVSELPVPLYAFSGMWSCGARAAVHHLKDAEIVLELSNEGVSLVWIVLRLHLNGPVKALQALPRDAYKCTVPHPELPSAANRTVPCQNASCLSSGKGHFDGPVRALQPLPCDACGCAATP